MLFKCVENRVITAIGTKVNHCQIEKSNTILIEHKNDWYLKSIKDIEITDNTNQGDFTKESYRDSTPFIGDTEYKYYIFLEYEDNTYNISELFITSNTFRTFADP